MWWTLALALACKDRNVSQDSGEAWLLDADADGFALADGDCNDNNPETFPGASEVCDGIDQDCDSVVDEDHGRLWYLDADGDGYGDDETWAESCTLELTNYVLDAGDCSDMDPSVNPGADEVCDGVDQNCDGQIDEALTAAWYLDADGDGYGDPETGVEGCASPGSGYVDNDFDCDDGDAFANALADDVCDGRDNDCDGAVDEAPDLIWYADTDQDGFGDPDAASVACSVPDGHVGSGTDCDDGDAAISPGAQEICDGLDNDCDGASDVDALDAPTWYQDADGDGYGGALTLAACLQPPGYADNTLDCEDADASLRPGADEYCDGVDNNCDGTVDEDSALDASTWYADLDADGYGDSSNSMASCAQPSGTSADATDCDDGRASSFPGADELCDTRDNDCDGAVDESGAIDEPSWYADLDGDGYGDSSTRTQSCTQPSGTSSDALDCNDADASISPSAAEICDGIDNDCDGETDPDSSTDALTWYVDADGDGYGSSDSGEGASCDQPTGYASDDSDCDDVDSLINPGATEVCDDGIDDDCSGVADDTCPEEHCGVISSDETWDSSVSHTVTCTIQVRAGSTLTIEDGTSVAFDAGTGMVVGYSSAGTLVINGSSSGVTFTSNESSPAAGDYDGLYFYEDATDSSAVEGLTLEYAGATTAAIRIYKSAPTISSTDIMYSGGGGIYVDGNGSGPSISSTLIQDCTGVGLQLTSDGELSDVSSPSFDGNTITGCGSYPVRAPGLEISNLSATSSYSGNGEDYVRVDADTLNADTTFAALDVDYSVSGTLTVQGSGDPILTLEDGVVLYFDSGVGLDVALNYGGGLDAQGSVSGITLTSGESVPAAGDWNGLRIGDNFYAGGSTLEGVSVSYGGSNGYGNLYVDAEFDADALTLQYSSSDCLYVDGDGDFELSRSTLSHCDGNGVTAVGGLGGAAAFDSNTVTSNGGYPVEAVTGSIGDLASTSSFSGNTHDYILNLSGDIQEDATWSALDVDYWIAHGFWVSDSSGPMWTVEDGVSLYIASGEGLSVGNKGSFQSGDIDVQGSSLGVTFTSSESSPAVGDWDGLRLSQSTGSTLEGLSLSYGGGGGVACLSLARSDLEVESCSIQSCENDGIYADSNSELLLQNSTVSGAEDYGVYVHALDGSGAPNFTGNTLSGNGVPLSLTAEDFHQLDSSSAYSGNTQDHVEIRAGTLSNSGDIQLLDVDYSLTGDVTVTGTVDVDAGVRFEQDSGTRWTVSGDLSASGSSGSEVVWTSAQASPSTGDWDGVFVKSGGSADLSYAEISYGGDGLSGNLMCRSSTVVASHLTLSHSAQYGFYDDACTETLSGMSYTGNLSGDSN